MGIQRNMNKVQWEHVPIKLQPEKKSTDMHEQTAVCLAWDDVVAAPWSFFACIQTYYSAHWLP